ncbi:MAG: hypothetical protein V2A66_08260 [Pseudomonadota bacterium]
MNKNNFMTTLLSTVLVIIAAIAFKPSLSLGSDKKPKFVEYVSTENYFKCRIPEDWSKSEQVFGLCEEEKRVYGVTLLGPPNENQVSTSISIHYYAPGNIVHKTMDKFIKLHAKPVFGVAEEGQSFSKVRQVRIAGRKAMAFDRIDIRFLGHEEINPKKVSVYERFVVVPAMDDMGFYVLILSVPEEIKDKYKETFEKTVKSFLPEK